MSRKVALAVFVLLLAAAVYGFLHEHLPAANLWSPEGRIRFAAYSAVYWAAAGLILLAAPRWLGAAASAFVLIYTAWWSGPLAPIVILYLFGAFFLTGKLLARRADAPTATLLGLTAAIFVIWIALHFRVNYRGVYAAVLAIPWVWEGRRWREHASRFRFLCDSRREAAALALLLFLLMAHWLVALQPEVSDDGLAMHLATPLFILHDGRLAFDFRQYTWTLMPAGAESLYTAALLLGSHTNVDAAPKLANFAMLAIIAGLIAQALRRWCSPARAMLVAALFLSTPVTQLVTGSLFVENVWAAMVLGASLAVLRAGEKDFSEQSATENLCIAGALLGTALAVKLIAALFIPPLALIAFWFALKRKQLQALVPASLLAIAAAAPPYVYAFFRSGNPAYPWLNTLFRSPDFDTVHPFVDARFTAPLSWLTPYLVTFRTGTYIEGQGGAAGFHYFLLLLPAAILAVANRQKIALLWLGIASVPILALLAFVPNLRYAYPAMPLFCIAIGIALARIPGAAAAMVVLTGINAVFLPSSGWYDKDFAFFHKAEAAAYREATAGELTLLARLNQTAPGQPVALFDTDAVAGFDGRAFTDSWHSYAFLRQVNAAASAVDIANLMRERGIRNIIAPASRRTTRETVDAFLVRWTDRGREQAGRMALYRFRDEPAPPPGMLPSMPPGEWDDLDERIQYSGQWIHDHQFQDALNGSVSYSAVPGDSLRLTFRGSGITYIYTTAFNRGWAEISIDGTVRATIDTYSPQIQWQFRRDFGRLPPGEHTFELRVLPRRDPASQGGFVDLDGVVITP